MIGRPSTVVASAGPDTADTAVTAPEDPVDLKIAVLTVGTKVVLAVQGELDVYTSPSLREAIIDQTAQGHVHLVVDMLGVDFMDDTGLKTLVDGLKRVRAKDGSLVLVCTEPRLLKKFEIAGLTKVFGIYSTIDAAVAGRRPA